MYATAHVHIEDMRISFVWILVHAIGARDYIGPAEVVFSSDTVNQTECVMVVANSDDESEFPETFRAVLSSRDSFLRVTPIGDTATITIVDMGMLILQSMQLSTNISGNFYFFNSSDY